MKTLLFGADGQVGYHLQKSLPKLGQLISYNRQDADLRDLEKLKTIIKDVSPDMIVNAAAYTAVDKAEDDIGSAFKINAEAVELMALEAKELNSWLIHYSTDYVFDGKATSPYIEDAQAQPLNVYGWTKLQGENATLNSDCKHLIFRTSWVYSDRRSNFVKTILALASDKETLNIVNDQIAVPTSAEFIAQTTTHCLKQVNNDEVSLPDNSGLYHLTPSGCISWYDFACFIIEEAEKQGFPLRLKRSKIEPIASSEYYTPAKRPSYSLLDNSKIREDFNVEIPDWKFYVKKLISELNLKETA